MSGLFGGNLLTVEQRQQAAMRKALEVRRQFWAHTDKDYVYKGGGDLLLQHGTFSMGLELPDEYKDLFRIDGGQGNCFRNAFYAAKEDPTLRYMEGVYFWGSGHPTPHAWCLAPDGRLLELTVTTDPEIIARGREQRSAQPMLPPDHWAYWGAQFHLDYVEATSDLEDSYTGVLDRPFADSLDGEQYTDWREHWPIFSYPYDPGRRVP